MGVDKALRNRFFRVLDLNLRFELERAPAAEEGAFLGRSQYVRGLHEQHGTDPVDSLRDYIEISATEGAYLFSGMRGAGKTTELLRLQYDLGEGGEFFVLYTDAKEHFNLLEPVEIGDFLLTLCAALAEQIAADSRLGQDFIGGGYWDRFVDTLFSEIELKEVTAEASWKNLGGGPEAKIGAKLALRDNPSFKKELQVKLRAKSELLARGAEKFLSEVAGYIKRRAGKQRVLLIVDSLEQFRGSTQEDALSVYQSVATLFSTHHDALRQPGLSIVYSIPPYLAAISQGFAAYYSGGRVFPLANVHVFDQDGENVQPNEAGMALMVEVVARRFPEWRTFFGEDALDRLILASGGDLRDLFRLIQNCLTSSRPERMELPFADKILDYAESVLREDFRFLTNADLAWLARVSKSHWHEMPTLKDLPQLAMLLDGKNMLNYRNGEDWYDVHPLLKERVKTLLPVADEAAAP